MGNTDISVADLASAIQNSLQEYSKEIAKGVSKQSKQAAKHAVETLRKTSPKDRDKYAEGWKSKTVKDEHSQTSTVVHNSLSGLTHLTENGHQLRQGGWSPGKAHIKPAEQQAIAEFEKGVESVIKNAGR